MKNTSDMLARLTPYLHCVAIANEDALLSVIRYLVYIIENGQNTELWGVFLLPRFPILVTFPITGLAFLDDEM